jgi:hypothetical protein
VRISFVCIFVFVRIALEEVGVIRAKSGVVVGWKGQRDFGAALTFDACSVSRRQFNFTFATEP